MAAGKPIIMGVDGDAADLVREGQCGYVAESENPRSIADAVMALMRLSVEQREEMANRSKVSARPGRSLSCIFCIIEGIFVPMPLKTKGSTIV